MTEEAFNLVQDELARARALIIDLQKQLTDALAGNAPQEQRSEVGAISVGVIVSHRTKQGLVNLRWGNLSAQLSVSDAREHAHGILAAAEAAQTDAFLWEYFTDTLGATPEMFSNILQDFRAFREK